MDRRSFLATTGVGLSVPLVGCVQAPGIRETEGPAGSSETGDPTSDVPTTEDEPTHDLVVENHTETTLTAQIRLFEQDGTTLVDGRYELPDRRGIEFDEVASWERTYTIELTLEGSEPVSRSWQTDECGPAEETPGSGGSRNATVRIEADPEEQREHQISLIVDDCDALYGPELPTGPARGFRLED